MCGLTLRSLLNTRYVRGEVLSILSHEGVLHMGDGRCVPIDIIPGHYDHVLNHFGIPCRIDLRNLWALIDIAILPDCGMQESDSIHLEYHISSDIRASNQDAAVISVNVTIKNALERCYLNIDNVTCIIGKIDR